MPWIIVKPPVINVLLNGSQTFRNPEICPHERVRSCWDAADFWYICCQCGSEVRQPCETRRQTTFVFENLPDHGGWSGW